MAGLDFLMNVTIADVADKITTRVGVKKQRNPEGLTIRVFRDGSVYPSHDLVEMFDLEYTHKDEKECGFGFDIIDTDLYPQIKFGKRLLLINPVSRSQAKVDLFGTTGYNAETGFPLLSVMEQGSKTFGEQDLVPSIEAIYGIKFKQRITPTEENKTGWDDGVDYVDMAIVANPVDNKPWKLAGNRTIAFLPKKVSRGKDKGEISTIRREDPNFYAFLPAEVVEEAKGDGDVDETEPENGEDVLTN